MKNNNKYYIVNRNNYFLGKLMTVRDFCTEQQYFNSRRRLGNMLLSGPGIVAGLNVFLVDDKTFSLESGFAIDYYGREIVVGSNCVRKFNLIKGFEEHKNKSVIYLCIRYNEMLTESTFSITSSGNAESEKQYNRINERYELFITDKDPENLNLTIDHLMFQNIEIYNLNGVHIWGRFPKFFIPNKKSKIDIFYEKETIDDLISFKLNISGVLFKKASEVSFKETEISDKKSGTLHLYVECNATDNAESELFISKHEFNLTISEASYSIDKDIKININVRKDSLKDILISTYYSMNFNDFLDDNEENFIYLAKAKVVVDGANYYVDNFVKHPANQYMLNNRILELIQNLDREDSVNTESVVKQENILNREKIIEQDDSSDSTDNKTLVEKDNVTTGIETINLGFKPKIGSIYYSCEFEHGLGFGHVGVITAIVNDEKPELKEDEMLVFGDKGIFQTDDIELSSPNVSCASVVNPKKGTMRIGVRVLERSNAQFVKIQWWAIKPLERRNLDDLVVDKNIEIKITPDTVTLKPLDQVRFSAEVTGAQDKRIIWELGKDNPGKIDTNGIYTASAQEGIFEVIARSAAFENIKSSAYVVVSIE